MRLSLLFASVLLTAACQRNVNVTTPTDAPTSGNVNGNTTPAPTSTNTVDLNRGPEAAFDTTARPAWLNARIQKLMAQKKQNPPTQIFRYRYDNQVVYYESAACCDQFSTLYNAKGQVMCQPDGGITGKGDGNCPNFNKNKTEEKLVWQDPRQ
ncbi:MULTISPECIES: DUF6970 domain-containing protein [Hymenobacter]|uniref:DUF6970 domain-containing protein n=1 Tax=Hymenobacter jejuensis TaxID=2502781 RepID=A0A5B7ZYP5_9BACT|nr:MULTISPECIES: hypothetical protein [Hymenobacter]MBC6991782.1 hypothetical protein [Hymenobacter sp. BT491]QDA60100.1 hypothetical protein FHG12_08260 [Hymenobacter jejuensis]